jgi:hypothetical protein
MHARLVHGREFGDSGMQFEAMHGGESGNLDEFTEQYRSM